jgi:hypothetical protein
MYRDNPLPLTRAWCLWELFATIETGSNFDVCLGPAEQALFSSELRQAGANLTNPRMFNTFKSAFDRIDVSKSQAGKPSELRMILAAVEATPGGCERCGKRLFSSHLYTKPINLQRQAQDRHRKS